MATHSTVIGMTIASASPGRNPRRRQTDATRSDRDFKVAHGDHRQLSTLGLGDDRGGIGRRGKQLSTMFSLAPGSHRGDSMPSERSTTRSTGCENECPSRSMAAAQ